MSPRIVVVGGGSYHWAPRLLCDFANTPSLTDAEVVLHDLDAERLKLMAELGAEIARRRGIGLTTTIEPDRKRAFAGADFVITCFSVGGFESMQHDIDIPRRYGIRQPIGDSVGPGGIMRALRSVPVLLDIARDVETVAPDAWFVNVTNPLTALCRSVTRETSVKTVGLCNEWVGATFNLSLALDCGMADLDPVLAGVNHFPLATQLRVNGEDAFAKLLDLMADPERAAAETIWMDPPPAMKWAKVAPTEHWSKLDVLENNAVRFEILRRFGVFPGSGDHHSVEFMPGFVHPGNDYGRGWRVHHYGMEGHRADAAEDVAHYESVRDASDVTRMPSGELVATLLDGIVTGKARTLPVNLPNEGNVTNLPDRSVVEIIGIADGSGVRGRDHATAPGIMGEFLRRINVVQEWTVESAITGDRTLVLEAMMADPMAGQLAYDDIVTMTDEMLEATGKWLPQFACSIHAMAPRIVIIGGASLQWVPKLFLDIVNMPSLGESELVLQDINAEPLPAMAGFVRHVNGLKGTGITVSTTTDRRVALEGADYVVVCISTGAFDSMRHDLEIPERYGIKQSVGDTVGPGGVMRALRNIPVLVEIARDMEEICPDVWMLNITNPMTTLCRAVTRETAVKTVGLCHEITGAQFTLSQILDVDFRSFDFEVVGVNHLPLITKLRIDGEDAMERLRERLADPEKLADEPIYLPDEIRRELGDVASEFTKRDLVTSNRVKFSLFDRFGVLPGAGDRHLVEFFPGFLTEASEWGQRWNVGLTSIADREVWVDRYQAEFAKLSKLTEVPNMPSGEMVAPMIDSFLRDKPRNFPLNLPNSGQCPDLPVDTVVESMVTATGAGLAGRDHGRAPAVLTECLRRVVASQEMTVEAAISGDRDRAVDAMLLDPLAGRIDFDQVADMTDEMLAATSQWLPQFS